MLKPWKIIHLIYVKHFVFRTLVSSAWLYDEQFAVTYRMSDTYQHLGIEIAIIAFTEHSNWFLSSL